MRWGRGRRPKDLPVYRWSDVRPRTDVEVDFERGPWMFTRVCDNGQSIEVIGGQYGHTRTFDVSRVSVKVKDIQSSSSSSSE